MKYVIIILILVILYFLVIRENYDPSANLNLLTNSEARFDKPVRIPISADQLPDNEIPDPVNFDQKLNITILQKLKAINNILERVREVSINDNKSSDNVFSNQIRFNEALQPVSDFEPDLNKLRSINKFITTKLAFYSGNQYILKVTNMDNAYGAETDDQYRIAYFLYGTIDEIKVRIIVDLLVIKSNISGSNLNIVFSELRIDNPNVYITPYNSNDNYERITDYNKSMK
jgi:hypothetical protein